MLIEDVSADYTDWFKDEDLKMNFTPLQHKLSMGQSVDIIVFAKYCWLPSKALTVKMWKGQREEEKWP